MLAAESQSGRHTTTVETSEKTQENGSGTARLNRGERQRRHLIDASATKIAKALDTHPEQFADII